MPAENHTTLTPDTPVRYLKGVGPKTAERFEKLGIVTLADLLCHYPRKYIDFTKPYSIAEAPADTECVVKAEVFAKPGGRILPGGRRMERITAGDDVSSLEITWFNNPYAAQKLELGQEYYFQGIVTGGMLRRQMVNPQVRTAEQIKASPFEAVYPQTEGLTSNAIAKCVRQLLPHAELLPDPLPEEMRPMGESICESFLAASRRLLDLGLGYLALDRAASTLSTGERQRMQLARAVRNRTTGVMYVLDEPSIGLHPANVAGLTGVMDDLVADGNTVVLVDHDTQILSHADHIVEMGPGAGADGGRVIAQGTVGEIERSPASRIGPFLAGKVESRVLPVVPEGELFVQGAIRLSTSEIHTVKPLEVVIPKGRLTVVTGVSGSGKTTLILESLVPALEAAIAGTPLPPHVKNIDASGIEHVKLIDSTPIGANVRSTVATYADIHDELRKIFARTPDARAAGYKAGDFSYNTGRLRCPVCDGTGTVSLDVQFLPDVDIPCPECRGSRYAKPAGRIACTVGNGRSFTLPQVMETDVAHAAELCAGFKSVAPRLATLSDLGLGYLTLGEATPSLSGGEAQRLKLASEMGRRQSDSLFVFDEPTIGLHPLDVRTLLEVFRHLLSAGATLVVIEHDLDMIRNADYIVDLGPGGGADGGRIVATGTPEAVAANKESITGQYLY